MRTLTLAAALLILSGCVSASGASHESPEPVPSFVAVLVDGRASAELRRVIIDRFVPPLRPRARPIVAVPAPRSVRVDRGVVQGSASRSGRASWYNDGAGLYAAVHSWRWGDRRYRLTVCRADDLERCVIVTVRDYCQCYVGTSRERVIDLSPDAFSRLAPLSRGVIKVTVSW